MDLNIFNVAPIPEIERTSHCFYLTKLTTFTKCGQMPKINMIVEQMKELESVTNAFKQHEITIADGRHIFDDVINMFPQT